MSIEEKIEEMVTSTNWGFAKMLKLHELSKELAIKLYDTTLSSSEIIDLIWEEQLVGDEYSSFGELYRATTISVLESKIMESFQHHFETATVNFNNPSKEEPKLIIEKPKSTPKPKTITKPQKDGTKLPKGMERV
tara:strand:+ start:1811 stop:2215 length:405 start_codon:yes stop_codon:yes gene_type:complete